MKVSENTLGALLMMGAMAAYTLNDTLMKALSGDMPLFQLLFLRGCLTSLAVTAIAWRMGAFARRVSRRDSGAILLRVIGEVASTYFFLTALAHMPLANVTALLQAAPLAITLAAAVFLRESVGWRRLVAILVGFIGVMLIVRPGAEAFDYHSLYGLAAVVCLTLRDLATRSLSRETSSMLVTFVTSVSVMAVFGLANLGTPWVPVAGGDWLMITGAATLIVGGYIMSISVVRIGDISFTAPFRYTSILWALVLGWLAFGDWPAPIVLLGAAVVVGSGVFTLWREAGLGRRRAPVNVLRPR